MLVYNNNQKYGIISIFFHWAMAIVIIATFLLGKNLQDNYENYYEVLALHNSFGLIIFFAAIFRLMWKWINIKPDQMPNKLIFMRLATISHICFYLIFFIMPLTGYLLTNFQGDIVIFFGSSMPEIFKSNRDLKYFAHEVHLILGNILLVLFSLHVLGALYHHYILKDNTLRRIIFARLK